MSTFGRSYEWIARPFIGDRKPGPIAGAGILLLMETVYIPATSVLTDT